MKLKYYLAFVLVIIIGLLSCGGDSDDGMATLNIDYNFKVGNESLEYGKTYTINGTAISFDAANFYVGGLKLTQENNSVIDISASHLLAGLNNTGSIEGEFVTSDIMKVDFFVGVDPTTNAQEELDFTNRPASDPLSIQDPSMHWAWSTGYKFLRVDGDTDTDGDGMPDVGVAYHLGSDAMLKNLSFSKRIDIKDGSNTITIVFDLEQFFKGVDMVSELDTHTGNNLPLANRLKDNLSTAISYE